MLLHDLEEIDRSNVACCLERCLAAGVAYRCGPQSRFL